MYVLGLAVPVEGAANLALVAEWDDYLSSNPVAAAERAWTLLSMPPHKMSEDDQRLRQEILSMTGGLRPGVGDVIVAGGVPLRCAPEGWERTADPAGD